MVVAIATGTFSCAQKKVNPPTAVITAFNKQFPGATKIKWEKEDGKYEAGFVQTIQLSLLYFLLTEVLKKRRLLLQDRKSTV